MEECRRKRREIFAIKILCAKQMNFVKRMMELFATSNILVLSGFEWPRLLHSAPTFTCMYYIFSNSTIFLFRVLLYVFDFLSFCYFGNVYWRDKE